jgi:hypothetical protein
MCFYMIVPISFGVLKSQKAFIFLVWLLFFVKKFESLCKNVNIFYVKSGDNHRPNYFSTSTPSGPHLLHHNRPIRQSIFDMEKYCQPITND